MCDNTYSRYKNLIRFSRFLGMTNLNYAQGTIYASSNRCRSALLLALLAFVIYDSKPSADPTRDVYYSKRNVSHFIEHFMVSLLIVGFTCCSLKSSEKIAVLFKSQHNIDVKLVARLKVQLHKRRFTTFAFAVIYVLLLTAGTVYFYGRVRKSLAIKLVLAMTLFFIAGILAEALIWLAERINAINDVLKDADKSATYCGLCLRLESQLFDALCFRHKLMISEQIYNEICDVLALINEIAPMHLFYLMGFFEVTGELLYFVPLVFKSQIDYNVCAINIALIFITCCGFLIAAFYFDWIVLKVNSTTANSVYNLQTPNVKIIEFTRRILLNPAKFTLAGNCVNLNFALQTANSIIIFCSILITFNYVV